MIINIAFPLVQPFIGSVTDNCLMGVSFECWFRKKPSYLQIILCLGVFKAVDISYLCDEGNTLRNAKWSDTWVVKFCGGCY